MSCNISNSRVKENQEFGINYEEALEQLTGLQKFEESERLKQEVKVLPQLAEMVPKRLTLNGFRDLISKMTPNIIVYRFDLSRTFLHKMAVVGNVIALRALLDVGPIDYREMVDSERNMTALHIAAKLGNVGCVEVLLKDSCPKYREMVDKNDCTALHTGITAKYVHIDCIKALLRDSRPEYREMRDKFGMTALFRAAYRRNVKSIEVLLENSRLGYREISDENGRSPLYIAIFYGKSDNVKALLKDSLPGYREKMITENGWTALHLAGAEGYIDCVKALLEDSRPEFHEIVDKYGNRAIDVTTRDDIVRYMLRDKYRTFVLSFTARTLSVLDEKCIFWCDDSTVKDTILWIIDEAFSMTLDILL
eukprot:TRINITY_DN3143_c1_g3_i2.p1 TRINITY_DN3143_c1_g3~~TRINITY_DN3143_c1_g3_i2.p1  ORF type:complete len:365 (+),score=64.54 TRINITY_DN3143_c1_g3_i2:318-1412(+)